MQRQLIELSTVKIQSKRSGEQMKNMSFKFHRPSGMEQEARKEVRFEFASESKAKYTLTVKQGDVFCGIKRRKKRERSIPTLNQALVAHIMRHSQERRQAGEVLSHAAVKQKPHSSESPCIESLIESDYCTLQ